VQTAAEAVAAVPVAVAEAEDLLPPQLAAAACAQNSLSERPPCMYQ